MGEEGIGCSCSLGTIHHGIYISQIAIGTDTHRYALTHAHW